MLGCSLLPILVSTYLISLFYSIIIGDGNVYEADWVPVSIGFAVACAILLLFVPYNLYIGNKLLKTCTLETLETNENFNEKQSTEELVAEKKFVEDTEL